MFEMMDAEMYDSMSVTDSSVLSDRAMALHKLSRLATLTTAADGYLTFMGNEFGHPEWIDFPREGNNWSFHHARRLWRLRDDPMLKYRFLAEFDRALTRLAPSLFPPPSRRPRLLLIARDDMILAFERCGLFFMLNFHPTRSVTDYPVQMPLGSYEVVMNTDEARFGGQSRIEMPQRYFTRPHETANAVIHQLRVYLPCRTAMVLRQVD